MTRNPFGGSTSDFVVTTRTVNSVTVWSPASATILFYDAETGGNQVTDLALDSAGTQPITSVAATSDGEYPTFYGPDSVTELWGSANGGPRVKLVSLSAAAAAVASAQSSATAAANSATAAQNAAASVPATTDAAVAPVLSDPESASAGVLAAAYASLGVAPQKHGAKGDGVHDDTAALQAWLAAGYSAGFLPAGVYLTTASLVQPPGMDVTFLPGATIKASAVNAGPVWDTPVSSLHRDTKLVNPTIDCNSMAAHGIFIRYAARFHLIAPKVIAPTQNGIILGDPGSPGASYEIMASDLYVSRANGVAPPAGSYGLWMRYCQDSRVHGSNVIQGTDVGVRMDRGSNQFEDVHVWGYGGYEPSIGFDDAAGHNIYIGCMADSPKQYGWKISAFVGRLVFCHAYIGVNSPTLDNVATGVYTTLDAPNIDLIGMHFEGGDATHRLAKDVDGASALWPPYVHAIGTVWNNVVTQNLAAVNQMGKTRFRDILSILADNANALGVRASDGTYVFNVNTAAGSRRAEVWNGSNMRGCADAGTTMTWQINGVTGAVRPGRTTTASRPSGSALTTGDIVFDVTIQKYIYWDGAGWRDFAGNAV